VLDASAIIAYLRDERGADMVEDLLANEDELCIAHAINLCEAYSKMQRYADESEVRSAIQDFGHRVVVRVDLDQSFWLEVGQHKAAMRRTPLADCFVVALANREEAEAVTADHEDFDPIQEQGICRVARACHRVSCRHSTFHRPRRCLTWACCSHLGA
jgi:uncharacterized protein